MKMLLPVLAKRLLSFALALVLLLSLCPALPLTANAYEYYDGWDNKTGFTGKFVTSDDDLIYEDDQLYDWKVYLHQRVDSLNVDVRATIRDESGNIVGGSYVQTTSYAANGEYSLMFSASDYSALTTDLEGTFELTLQIAYKSVIYATLIKSFTRVINDTPDDGGNTASNGWEPTSKYYWVNGAFTTGDEDLIYEEGQAYDWTVTIQQSRRTTPVRFEAEIKDEAGNTVSSYSDTRTATASSTPSEMFNWSNFSALTQDLGGTFTLTADFYLPENGDEHFGKLTQTFTRIAQDNNASFEATSRSNPDMVFTYADPIDLVLHIEKTDGVEESFYAATTITNTNGETIAEKIYVIPSSTNIDVSVKDMVPVTNIKTHGNYSVNVALYGDIAAPARYTTTIPFAVVAMDRTVNISISAADTYEGVPTPAVQLQKPDGVAEYCNVQITVTDTSTGNPVFTHNFDGTIPGTGYTTIHPELGSLPVTGSFRMDVVVTDSEGNQLSSNSRSFERISSTPLTANLTDHITGSDKAGMIFSDTDNPLVLTINHPSSANKMLQIRYTGTYNGEPLNDTREFTMPANGTITLDTADFVKYGIYENLQFSIHTADGTEKWKSIDKYDPFSFSFVIDNTHSASLSLLNINDHFTGDINGDYNVKLPLSAQAGAKTWRASIPWVSVEPSKNTYRMPTSVKEVLNRTAELGMQAMIILAYNNDNYLKDAADNYILDENGNPQKLYGEADPDNPEWLAAYANYCEYIATYMATEENGKYKDLIVGFEIWNEWNHATMSKVPDKYDRTGDKYAEVVKAASNAIRAVNDTYETSFKVVAGATAGDGYSQGTNTDIFLDAMFQVDGIVDYMDAFSFHTYPNPEQGTNSYSNPRYFEFVSPGEFSYINRVNSVQARLDAAKPNHNVEIWLTETSWSTFEIDESLNSKGQTEITTGATEAEAAAYMTQLYAWALQDGTLDRIFWYDLMNDQKKLPGTNYYDWYDNKSECNWGLVHCCDNTGDDPLAYSAKQGYVAMCAISSKLGGATNGRSIALGSGIHAYQFEKGSRYLMVAWTDDDADTTRTATFNGSVVITDMFGNATTYDGTATLKLSESPIYIEYAKNDVPSIS